MATQCFKLKVGRDDDEERVAAVREAIGTWPALRLDANGAWTVDEAVERITALEANDLELVEQPCATLPELAQVRKRVSTPIAADESITGPDDVRAAAAEGACDAVNVKLASCGGVERARAAPSATAGESGIAAYLSSTFDGPWGISAALQLAAGETFQLACGLATLELFDVAAREAGAGRARRAAAGAGGTGTRGRAGRRPAVRGARQGRRVASAATASGSSSCGACPAPGIIREGAVRQCRGHPPAGGDVFLVKFAGEQQHRHREFGEPIPDGRHNALAVGAEQVRELTRVMRKAPLALGGDDLRRLRGEHGLCLPVRDDVLDRAALNPLRELLVGLAARLRVVHPRAHAHEHEGRPAIRLREGSVEHDPAAHRVRDRDHARLRRQLVCALVKSARIAFDEPVRDRSPGVAALHEPGHEGERRPLHATSQPHLRTAAGARRRACAVRNDPRRDLPGVPQRAVDLRAGGDRRPRGGVRARRALGRIPRAGDRKGERTTGRDHLHVGHGCGQSAPGRRRGVRGARSADRPDRRPPARAARHRRRTGDRPAQALRLAPRNGSSRSATTSRVATRPSSTARSRAERGPRPRAGARGRCI